MPASVCLIDTSVFCNVIPVPGRDQNRETVRTQMERYSEEQVVLLLPLAAIVETGNLIARCRDGTVRRQTASRFCNVVRAAITGKAPFEPTPLFEPDALLGWLDEFPESAMRQIGFGDLSIAKEFERQCALNPGRRVFVWSFDAHLRSLDHPAREW